MARQRFILVGAIAAMACLSNEARAAETPHTYVVAACKAGSSPAPLAGWVSTVEGLEAPFAEDRCSQGGAFGFTVRTKTPTPGKPPGQVWSALVWKWQAPPDLVMSSLRMWRTGLVVSPTEYEFIATDLTGVSGVIDSANRLDDGSARRDVKNMSATALSITTACTWTTRCVGGQYVYFDRLEMDLRDEFPPTPVGPVAGSLLYDRPASGIETMSTGYTDRGGGVTGATLLVDGSEQAAIRTDAPTCSEPYITAVPCPLKGLIEIPVDTTLLADGEHRVEMVLNDVAGNATVLGPYAVSVRNHANANLGIDEVGLTSATKGRAGKVMLKKRLLKPRYTTGSVLAGVVVDTQGDPVAGVQVDPAARVNVRGANFEVLPAVVTDANGAFRVPIPAGPSRIVRVSYQFSEVTAEVRVSAPVRLSASPSATRNGRVGAIQRKRPGHAVVGLVASSCRPPWASGWVPFRTSPFGTAVPGLAIDSRDTTSDDAVSIPGGRASRRRPSVRSSGRRR